VASDVQETRRREMADTRAEIRKYIEDEFVVTDGLDLDAADLLEEEVIDSLGIFSLISFIEEKFGVAVEPEEINLENFQTLDTITKLVESKG
jgi:acyl carrier protein